MKLLLLKAMTVSLIFSSSLQASEIDVNKYCLNHYSSWDKDCSLMDLRHTYPVGVRCSLPVELKDRETGEIVNRTIYGDSQAAIGGGAFTILVVGLVVDAPAAGIVWTKAKSRLNKELRRLKRHKCK